MALLLLLVGAWASIATSPAQSSVQKEGEMIIAADQPVMQFSWQATSDETPDRIWTSMWWDLSTETGADAELSVAFPDRAQGHIDIAPLRAVDEMDRQGTLEFVVTNPEETGAVTMNWNVTASLEADQAELGLTVSNEAGDRPSSEVSLPYQPLSFYDETQVALIYSITATAPAGSAGTGLSLELEPLDELDRGQDVISTVTVDGTANRFVQETEIPWPSDCGATCQLDVELVVTAPPGLTVNSNDPDGTVTIVTSQPFQSEPVWVELGSTPFLSETQVVVLDIGLPVGDPIDQQVVLTARMDDQPDEQFCSVPVTFRLADRRLQDSELYLSGDWVNYVPALLDKGGESVEVRIGPAGNPAECEGLTEESLPISIGVITYGLTPPAQATVSIR